MRSVRVHPRLRACLGLAFTIIGSVFVLLLIVDLVKGRLTWDKVQLAGTIVCVIGTGMALFLYGIGWAFATTISETGLRGPMMCGFRTTIGWNDIASVRRVTVKGLPYLLIRSRSSKKELWFCILGFNESAIMERLLAFVSTDSLSSSADSQGIT